MSGPEILDVTVKLLGETDKAWKLTDDGKRWDWFPKSICELDKNPDGKTYNLQSPTWLLNSKDWI